MTFKLFDLYLKIKLLYLQNGEHFMIKTATNLIRKVSKGQWRKLFCLTLTFKSNNFLTLKVTPTETAYYFHVFSFASTQTQLVPLVSQNSFFILSSRSRSNSGMNRVKKKTFFKKLFF